MKKIILFLFIFMMFITSQKTLAGSGCCSWHGGQSYCDTSVGKRVCNDGTYSPTCTCGGGSYDYYTPTYNTYSCSSYGIYAINNYDGTCSCMSGYHFETGIVGGKTCVKDKTCSDLYGYNSVDNYDGTCSCKDGYSFQTDTLGNKTCVSDNDLCQDEFGYGAKSTGDGYCGCKSGYIMGLDIFGKKQCNSGYTYCSSIYGVNSKFNSLSNSCECYSGYEWNSDKTSCVKPKAKCGLNSSLSIDGKTCSCNIGYIWESSSDTKNMNCIKQKTYTEICQETYGNNSYGDKDYCYCNSGYIWNSDKTTCIKEVKKTATEICQDNFGINSYSDGTKADTGGYNCYCLNGYEWNLNNTSCILKTEVSNISETNKKIAENIFNNIKSKIKNYSKATKEKVYKNMIYPTQFSFGFF